MAEKSYYYRPVPGSRELLTSRSRGDRFLELIEKEGKGGAVLSPLRFYRGEWLGGAVIPQGVSIPLSVFDDLAPLQTPVEQAVYLQLFRLSYGEGRNWCRGGKKELKRRCQLSDRRLNVALDGLVRKGHLRPLHRNTRGTLYRVYLPSEVLGLAEMEVRLGEKIGAPELQEPIPPAPAEASPRQSVERTSKLSPRQKREAEAESVSAADPRLREKPLESPLNEERFEDLTKRGRKGPGVAEMAEYFFQARGLRPRPHDRQLAVTTLTGVLEDGFSREEVMLALEWFIKNLSGEKSLDRLPYFIGKALEETKGGSGE